LLLLLLLSPLGACPVSAPLAFPTYFLLLIAGHTLTVVNGAVYLAGGWNSTSYFNGEPHLLCLPLQATFLFSVCDFHFCVYILALFCRFMGVSALDQWDWRDQYVDKSDASNDLSEAKQPQCLCVWWTFDSVWRFFP
jgi:hypothetical protein